ncbi:MAG: nucleotide-binding protein [Betaproteobacteria bacterium SG8_41]|nr:MAG: nucleotide-binding protein [Betaproteobacteria bacterium SG8_41]
MQLILITGLSGSGKSVALHVLEDSGFYHIDNLPARLLPDAVDFLVSAGHPRAAISLELRGGEAVAELLERLAEFKRRGVDARMLFLETKADTLIKRFSETRRRHPLSDDTLTLPECIERERALLSPLADAAHRVDTSDLSPSALRSWVKDFMALPRTGLTTLFESFGFKHGIPLDADLVFDVRCLPNPNYDPRLQPLTGRDAAVIEFMGANPQAGRMLADIRRFIDDWLPCFERDNRSYLTIAIGCTGGRHRSVYFVETLAEHFKEKARVLVRHRELS